ncbi:MAG: heat-inducible transcriptional repressor HrcA [Mycoplasmataceae bacterium]|nr:heat-inducible transcriptional repressor HrcA [Mycoplasmataceae bacterium]
MKKCKSNDLIKKEIINKTNDLNEREKLFLRIIVEEYINTANPVGSIFLLQTNKDLDYSSATVRNIMSNLEKKGYLVKNHTSSGRVPSTLGFKYYEENLVSFNLPLALKNKLSTIFKKRNSNIDEVIADSVKLISDIMQLPTIITSVHEDTLIKKIELIQLDNNNALLIIVFSDSNLIKNEINFLKPELINDISICVQILNDRLINLNIKEVLEQINIVSRLIKEKVKNYEFIMQQILERIFNQNFMKNDKEVIATKNVLKHKEFQEVNKLNKVLNLLDNSSIWEQLALKSLNEDAPKITFGNELNQEEYADIAIATTNININDNTKKQISIVGPTRMKYGEVIALLSFIKNELENND